MKNILIIRKEKAYLPEADAYRKFFIKNNFNVKIEKKINNSNLDWADIIWNFMGVDCNYLKYKKEHFIIHDYRSLSSSFYKDKIRKIINVKPNLRIFLNDIVKKEFNFNDNINFLNLDMGIDESFLNKNITKKEYKFVYCGSINKFREVDKMIDWFLKTFSNTEKFLLIGEPTLDIKNKYEKNLNIIFTGKVLYEQVSSHLKKAEYAFCNIPNIYPYNSQTPTKLLEYIALDLKIIANKTPWIMDFLKKEKEQKLYLYENIDELCMDDINNSQYYNIKMNSYLWDEILNKSNILNILNSNYCN